MSLRSNPWLTRRVLSYAHQGGALEAPSSTLFAFRRSISVGCDALEMDVHKTKDGVLVVSHDETVDSTTGSSGVIANLEWADLRLLDNSYWFRGHGASPSDRVAYPYRGIAPADRSFGYVQLSEVLDEFTNVFLNLDIKETWPAVRPYEKELASLLRRYERIDDVIVASFHDSALNAFRKAAPEIHTSLGPTDCLTVGVAIRDGGPEPALAASAVALQLPRYFGDEEILDHEFIAGAHDRSLAVHAWTIDDATEMSELIDRGIDGLISDRPSILVSAVGSRRPPPKPTIAEAPQPSGHRLPQ